MMNGHTRSIKGGFGISSSLLFSALNEGKQSLKPALGAETNKLSTYKGIDKQKKSFSQFKG